MAITINKIGYSQVEPNHLSGIVTGQIYAQLPADSAMGDTIENGMFAVYDLASGKVNLTGEGEWMLVYNEEKLYDERKQSHKDFALTTEQSLDGAMYPRLIKTLVGDIYTTNAFADGTELSVGDKLYVGSDGYLCSTQNSDSPVFQVVKEYTMADGQNGVKIQRIA